MLCTEAADLGKVYGSRKEVSDVQINMVYVYVALLSYEMDMQVFLEDDMLFVGSVDYRINHRLMDKENRIGGTR